MKHVAVSDQRQSSPEDDSGAQDWSSPTARLLLQPGLLWKRSFFFNQSSVGIATRWGTLVKRWNVATGSDVKITPPRPRTQRDSDSKWQECDQWPMLGPGQELTNTGTWSRVRSGPSTGAHLTWHDDRSSSATRSSLITILLLLPVFFLRSASRPGNLVREKVATILQMWFLRHAW